MGIITATFKDACRLQLGEWDGSRSSSYLVIFSMCAERSRVVPTSAFYIDGDSQLHLVTDGDGHNHLQRDDDCHRQLERIGILMCAERSRMVPTSAFYIDGDSHLHLVTDWDGHHHLQRYDDCHVQLEQVGMAHISHHTCLCHLCVHRD